MSTPYGEFGQTLFSAATLLVGGWWIIDAAMGNYVFGFGLDMCCGGLLAMTGLIEVYVMCKG